MHRALGRVGRSPARPDQLAKQRDSKTVTSIVTLPSQLLSNWRHRHIHTEIFQGKIKNFPGLETPPDRSSDPTVQYSVGPMVRSYTRHVPILQMFFISELGGPGASV